MHLLRCNRRPRCRITQVALVETMGKRGAERARQRVPTSGRRYPCSRLSGWAKTSAPVERLPTTEIHCGQSLTPGWKKTWIGPEECRDGGTGTSSRHLLRAREMSTWGGARQRRRRRGLSSVRMIARKRPQGQGCERAISRSSRNSGTARAIRRDRSSGILGCICAGRADGGWLGAIDCKQGSSRAAWGSTGRDRVTRAEPMR